MQPIAPILAYLLRCLGLFNNGLCKFKHLLQLSATSHLAIFGSLYDAGYHSRREILTSSGSEEVNVYASGIGDAGDICNQIKNNRSYRMGIATPYFNRGRFKV